MPKPDKDCTSIKGYRIVTMQNITRNVSEKIVARRLFRQSENDNILPSTLGSNRVGKDTWANAAVIASEVYDAFEKRDETLFIALDLKDSYNHVDLKTIIRTGQHED